MEIGPFHKCFTAIVGPNGSGKSNLIESLLFVFGNKAKKMRLNKIAELIHNSAKHGDCSQASVSVVFVEIEDHEGLEEDEYVEVPHSRLEISRTVFKNNTSKYFINLREASYNDVVTRLGNIGIDLTQNRFLILQGEVEQISLMAPKATKAYEVGLLEYLEDIIGSNKHMARI